MKQIRDLVRIMENNENCVILEFIGSELDLIKFGFFKGNERYYRITKSKCWSDDTIMTVWYKDGTSDEWYYGRSTLCIGSATAKLQCVLNGYINNELGTKFHDGKERE